MTRSSRRTLVRAAAWTAPIAVVSTAAPTYAASGGCVDAQAVMGPVNTTPTGATFPPSDLTATIAFTASGYPSGSPSAFLAPSGPLGQYVILSHPSSAVPGGAITMTMTFSRPVSNLSLSVYDIDRSNEIDVDWADHVVVNTSGYTIPARDADVVGSGSTADPLRNSTNGQGVSTENFATLLWSGPVTEVQLTYLLGGTTVKEFGGQDVGVTQIGFTC